MSRKASEWVAGWPNSATSMAEKLVIVPTSAAKESGAPGDDFLERIERDGKEG